MRNKTKNNNKSKLEAMFSPRVGRKKDAAIFDEESDNMIEEQEFYSYTKKFKYLGSICTPSLKDDEDIKR